jgi:PAS domain S-box-containing protein
MERETGSNKEELRQSEDRFKLLVQSVRDYAIFMLDPNGVVLTWNAGAERFKGYRADEIIGAALFAVLSPRSASARNA